MRESVSRIYEILAEHNALLVHFSGSPKGSGNSSNEYMFPDDLKHVLNGEAQGGLSCSTVKPNDSFAGIERNATGCIGLVLGLRDKDSLLSADCSDCGTYLDDNSNRLVEKIKVSKLDIHESINNRAIGNYNEWAVKNYYVIGLFAVAPFEVSVNQQLPEDLAQAMGVSSVPGIQSLNIRQIENLFSTQRIFSFYDGRVVEYIDGKFINIDHNSLYPTAKS